MAEVVPNYEAEPQVLRSVQRTPGIDAFRVVMAFLVVILHTLPGRGSNRLSMVAIICHCSVPFFLITSGYYLKIPPRLSAMFFARPLMRLLPIYLFWMIIFYCVAYVTKVSPLRFGVRELLSGGTAFHLWYLPALLVATVLVPISVLKLGMRVTGLICGLLAIVVIARGAYHDLFHLPATFSRDKILVAPIFLFTGFWLARRQFSPSKSVALAMAVAGFAIIVAEELMISRWVGMPFKDHAVSIGTFAFSAGVFLFARALPLSAAVERLATLGKYTLGIYVSHLLFIWGLVATFGSITRTGLLWRAPMAFACALLLTVGLQKIPYLRRIVA